MNNKYYEPLVVTYSPELVVKTEDLLLLRRLLVPSSTSGVKMGLDERLLLLRLRRVEALRWKIALTL